MSTMLERHAGKESTMTTHTTLDPIDTNTVAGPSLAWWRFPSMIGEGWLGFWLLLSRRIER